MSTHAVRIHESGIRRDPTSRANPVRAGDAAIRRAASSASMTLHVSEAEARYAPAPPIHAGFSPVCAADASGSDETADLIEDLGDEIATLSAHIHAATHRLLTLIARFDSLRGWEIPGHRSCAHWLAARTGIDLGAAREKVRAARALEALPQTSAAMARGELSFSQVRALTRVAHADSEGDLLVLARGTTTAQLERMVRAWKVGNRKDEAERERERHASRTFSVFPDDNGMYVVRGRLTPEVGALLMRAIEAASDALYRERSVVVASSHPDVAAPAGGSSASSGGSGSEARATAALSVDPDRDAAQRRADAIGLLAERALAAGFAAAVSNASMSQDESVLPISGTRAQRYQVVLHVDAATLETGAEPGRSELEDGTRVSAETSRRLSCDASVVRVKHARDGVILDVGRRTRTIPPALRRALDVRDRGCRFPGCGLRFTDAHHVVHWADGGPTSLANCLLLCGWHHRLVHEGGWRIDWWGEGRPVFLDPRGHAHFDGGWTPPALSEEPVEALIAMNERSGVRPEASTPGARWRWEADIPDRVYFRAMGAVQEAIPD